jgi:hypothetical protein
VKPVFRRARELGPALLVPLAWLFVTAAHLDAVTDHTLFVAHVVMSVLLVGFAATGRADMQEGTLRVWWNVIAAGAVLTLVGTAGFLTDPASGALQAVALVGWMLLPAVGFLDTGRRSGVEGWIYFVGAAGCLFGAVLYGAGVVVTRPVLVVAGLALVGAAQTVGILHAVVRN